MGNVLQNNTNEKIDIDKIPIEQMIDYIATNYILTTNFTGLKKLYDQQYCNKLVILTSEILDKNFSYNEITYISNRIKEGSNEKTDEKTDETNGLEKDKVVYFENPPLNHLDVPDITKKKHMCLGIAKFYVKIAHVFAAIVMTINPVYTYKDATGQTVKTGLLEKDKIPKNINRKLYKLNICDNRIRALKKGEQLDETTGNVSLQPKVCDMNVSKTGIDKTLADEPGITELMKLYLDDKYDFSNGNFTGMSDSTKTQFAKDLKLFYTAFTGNESMPAEITKFSDIKLRDYNKRPGCHGANPVLKTKYTINMKDKLFIDYAENTKKMIQSAADNQSKLLSVINEIFTYVIDPYSNKKVIRVNPKLTDDSLQKAVEKSRRLIVDLYIKCETDYVNGVKLYEAIVETKILETTQKQIEALKSEASKIIKETKSAVSTTVKEEPFVKPPPVVVAGVVKPANPLVDSSIETVPTTVTTESSVPTTITTESVVPTTVTNSPIV